MKGLPATESLILACNVFCSLQIRVLTIATNQTATSDAVIITGSFMGLTRNTLQVKARKENLIKAMLIG